MCPTFLLYGFCNQILQCLMKHSKNAQKAPKSIIDQQLFSFLKNIRQKVLNITFEKSGRHNRYSITEKSRRAADIIKKLHTTPTTLTSKIVIATRRNNTAKNNGRERTRNVSSRADILVNSSTAVSFRLSARNSAQQRSDSANSLIFSFIPSMTSYKSSPAKGWPRCEKCTLIWCVLPVTSRTLTSDILSPFSFSTESITWYLKIASFTPFRLFFTTNDLLGRVGPFNKVVDYTIWYIALAVLTVALIWYLNKKENSPFENQKATLRLFLYF